MYKIINLTTSVQTPLFPYMHSPSITQIASEFLLVTNTIGMFISHAGDVVRGTLEWSTPPTSVIASYPYVIASVGEEIIVHDVTNQSVVWSGKGGRVNGVVYGWDTSVELDDTLEVLKRRGNGRNVLASVIGVCVGEDSVVGLAVPSLDGLVERMCRQGGKGVEMGVRLAENREVVDRAVYLKKVWGWAGLACWSEAKWEEAEVYFGKGDVDVGVVCEILRGRGAEGDDYVCKGIRGEIDL
jgi:hypothetical protein